MAASWGLVAGFLVTPLTSADPPWAVVGGPVLARAHRLRLALAIALTIGGAFITAGAWLL